jgi:hypothetical protein
MLTAKIEAELSTRPQHLVTTIQTPMYLLNFMLGYDNNTAGSGLHQLIQRSAVTVL